MSVPVIVTGNLGYLGPIVVKKLREQGAVILGVDPNFYPVELPYAYTADFQVSSIDKAPRAFWEPRTVVHLAAISNDPMAEVNKALTYDTNVGLVAELAEAFQGAKHVLASSASVYGFGQEFACSETSELNPLSAYADSKIKAERVLDMLNPNSTMLRFGTLWGAAPNFRTDLAINHFAIEALVNKKIAPLSDSKRPILHVDDAADAIVKAALAGKEEYAGVYNVLGQNVSIFEAARKVGASMNVDVETDASKSDSDKRSYHIGTFRTPHLVSPLPILLGDEDAMSRLAASADKFKDRPGRIVELKKLLDASGVSS